jgi:hypothetical protein
MDNNQKKNYSGSSEYRVFKVLHPEDPKKKLLQDKKKLKETSGMGERGEDWSDATDEPFVKAKAEKKKLKEEADAVDTVTMDIPLLIRVLEFAREDAKTDMDLHKVVENLINMRGDGTLSMQNYAKIVAIKEHIESLDEISKKTAQSYLVKAGKELDKGSKTTQKRDKRIDGYWNASKRLSNEKPTSEEVENLSELSKSTLKSYIKGRGETIHADKRDSNAARNTAADAEYHGQQKKADDWHDEADWLHNRARKGATNVTKAAIKVAKKTNEEVGELSELSTELLGRYKKAAGAQASAADKAGNYAKGNKRFSGIVKATKKQFDNDAKKINELKKQPDNMDADDHLTREDLRKWFSKTDPEGDWKRINSKGEAIGPCAREPGEPKPKCMSKEKRSQLSKGERAAAVATKRKHDPVADRSGKGGKPVNVSNYGKGKLGEETVDEACWPTHKKVGMKNKGGKMVPNCVPKNEEVQQIHLFGLELNQWLARNLMFILQPMQMVGHQNGTSQKVVVGKQLKSL